MNDSLIFNGRQLRYLRIQQKALARLRLHFNRNQGGMSGLKHLALEFVLFRRSHRFARRMTYPGQLYFQQGIKANQRVELTTARPGVTAAWQARSTALSRLVLRSPGAPSSLSHTDCSCTSRASARFSSKQRLLSGQW